jgi:hypothetical protein
LSSIFALNIKPFNEAVIDLCILRKCTIFRRQQQSSTQRVGGSMTHLDIKIAIIRSGRHEYEIARTLGVSENALSKFIRGHGNLRPEQVDKLFELLGLRKAAYEPSRAAGAGL